MGADDVARDTMTPRRRMLAAYRREVPDRVPVSPELWDATAIAVSGRPWHELVGPFATSPWWRTHLAAFEHFGCDAWIVPGPGPTPRQAGMCSSTSRFVDAETIETRKAWKLGSGTLDAVSRTTATYADWLLEHPVKRFPEDMRAYERYIFDDPASFDLEPVAEALRGVGEKGLVTPYVGSPFSSFLGLLREGGMAQSLYDIIDHEGYCRELLERYVEHCAGLARAILAGTDARVIFIESGYSAPPVLSPALYRAWDVPVLAAVAQVCHARGALLHLHHHGYVFPVIEEIISAGVDLICPLLPPPQGDVTDLAALKRRCAGRIALKGNVDPFRVLLRGPPRLVEEEVRKCIAAAAAGGGYVLGTADSTVVGTPFENIRAFVRAGRLYGRVY